MDENIVKEEVVDTADISDLVECCDSQPEPTYLMDNIIKIPTEDVGKSKLDTKEFQRGINDVSRLCGMITALVNVGITPSMALSYISETESNKTIIDSNYKIAELQSETAKDTAKFNYEVSQKNMI